MYPSLSIHIVAWNSMRFLPDLLKSLSEQTFQEFSVLVIDNGSTDGVAEFLRRDYPQVALLRNARNLGFDQAHNQGIRYALERWESEAYSDRFVLITNPDTILAPDCLEHLLNNTRVHPKVGAFTPKLRRAFGEHEQDEVLQETVKSDLIDSTGLRAFKTRVFTDRGAGEMDEGQYDQQCEVFGVSGALALYRAQALQDVRFEDEFFDQDFFAYKEDVDLAWRMQYRGWGARLVPEALAYHHRGLYGKERMGLWQRLKQRRHKSKIRSYYSTRNHVLMLIKNERFWNGLLASPWILPYEFGRFVYTLLLEPRNLRAYMDVLRLFPRMLKKRAHTMKTRTISAKQLRAWFV